MENPTFYKWSDFGLSRSGDDREFLTRFCPLLARLRSDALAEPQAAWDAFGAVNSEPVSMGGVHGRSYAEIAVNLAWERLTILAMLSGQEYEIRRVDVSWYDVDRLLAVWPPSQLTGLPEFSPGRLWLGIEKEFDRSGGYSSGQERRLRLRQTLQKLVDLCAILQLRVCKTPTDVGVRQRKKDDSKSDKKSDTPRPWGSPEKKCAAIYVEQHQKFLDGDGLRPTLDQVITEFLRENVAAATTLKRNFASHPEYWKPGKYPYRKRKRIRH